MPNISNTARIGPPADDPGTFWCVRITTRDGAVTRLHVVVQV